MTGAREAEVEVRRGELGLPVVEIDAKDINIHMKAIKSATEQKDTYVALLRGAKKRANELHPGLASEIEETIRDQRKNNPQALAERLALKGVVLKATGSTIQLTVFDTLAGDHADQVSRRFYEDGKAGRAFDSRYPENSDLHRIAREQWTRGQGELQGLSPEEAAAVARKVVSDDGEQESEDGELFDLKSPSDLPGEQSAETAH